MDLPVEESWRVPGIGLEQGLGFGGLGFRGLGFRGLGFRFKGLGFRVYWRVEVLLFSGLPRGP